MSEIIPQIKSEEWFFCKKPSYEVCMFGAKKILNRIFKKDGVLEYFLKWLGYLTVLLGVLAAVWNYNILIDRVFLGKYVIHGDWDDDLASNMVLDLMNENYKEDTSEEDHWDHVIHETQSVEDLTFLGYKQKMVIAYSREIEDPRVFLGDLPGCHGCGVVYSFFYFTQQEGYWKLTKQYHRAIASGQWGLPGPELEPILIGRNKLGILQRSSFTNMGYISRSDAIYMLGDNEVSVVFYIGQEVPLFSEGDEVSVVPEYYYDFREIGDYFYPLVISIDDGGYKEAVYEYVGGYYKECLPWSERDRKIEEWEDVDRVCDSIEKFKGL